MSSKCCRGALKQQRGSRAYAVKSVGVCLRDFNEPEVIIILEALQIYSEENFHLCTVRMSTVHQDHSTIQQAGPTGAKHKNRLWMRFVCSTQQLFSTCLLYWDNSINFISCLVTMDFSLGRMQFFFHEIKALSWFIQVEFCYIAWLISQLNKGLIEIFLWLLL